MSGFDSDNNKLLRIQDVCARTTLKKSNIHKMVAEKKFPPSIKLGGATVWLSSEVNQWIAEKIEQRHSVENEGIEVIVAGFVP